MAKVLIAEYRGVSIFKIPKGLDLEDKTIVSSYYVKWDKLYVNFVDTTKDELVIEYSASDDIIYRHPHSERITLVEDLDDVEKQLIWDTDDEDEEEIEEEVKEDTIDFK
jgi:hypothetical protein